MHGLKLVEDAAQAHGAEVGGRRAGSLADAAAFSFYPTKNLGALGDAGAVMTNDAEVAEEARRLRADGERERYDSVRSGWNSRLDTLQAALLLVELSRTWRNGPSGDAYSPCATASCSPERTSCFRSRQQGGGTSFTSMWCGHGATNSNSVWPCRA